MSRVGAVGAGVREWTLLLSSIAQLLLIALAGYNFDDTELFYKLVAALGVLTLGDIGYWLGRHFTAASVGSVPGGEG